jgi:hypothetical protein
MRILNSSPIFTFERLSQTVENPLLMRSEPVEVDGKKVDCHLIQFSSGRRKLGKNERPGPSSVWVAQDSGLVLREEIRTSKTVGEENSESRYTTAIERFRINEEILSELFLTKDIKQ